MRISKGREYDDNLSKVKDQVTEREDRVIQLHKLLEPAKSCAEPGHFDMANKLFSEFDELSKKY